MTRAALLAILAIGCSGTGRVAAQDGDERGAVALYMAGRYSFQQHCAVCHGSTGRGNGPWAGEMEVKPRNFRTGLYKFRTTPYGKLPVDEDLRRTIREGISGTSMPMFSHLREDDLAALIAYLKQLSRLWADPALMVSPMRVPEPPDWFSRPMDRAAHAKAGGARFSAQCAVCHGTEGKGDGPGGRGLFDAWEQPIRPADLTTPHPKSGDSPRDLFRTVATGLNGTPMAGFAPQLSEGEIWELVAWMESLRAGG